MLSICQLFLYFVVHQVGGKLTGWAAAFYKAPADSVINALVVQLDNSQACFRVYCYISEIFAASGYQEKLSCKSRHLCADWLPLSRCIQTGADHFYFLIFQTIA